MEGENLGTSSLDTAAAVEAAKQRRKRDASTDQVDGEAELLAFLEKKRRKLEEEAKLPKRKPEPELLEWLGRMSFGSDFTEPEWLGQKRMTKTDVHPHHQRLFIPASLVEKLKPHLKAWEKGETEPDVDAPGILVSVVDPSGCERELKLKRWSSLHQWALIKGWQPLVDGNQLREGDLLGIWVFRHGPKNQLAFILQKIHH